MSRALAALLLFASTPAYAFEITTTTTGADVHVARFPIVYDVVGAELAVPTRRAFDTWAKTSGGTIVPSYGGLADAAVPMDGVTTIVALETWDRSFGPTDQVVAHAEVFYDVTTGVTDESDIYLNAQRFTFEPTNGFDPESVVLHELGHALGLAHTCGDPGRTYPSCFDLPPGARALLDAVMAPTLAVARLRRSPTADDAAAIEAQYGAGGRVPELVAVERRCPSGELALLGAFEPDDEVVLRGEDGSTTVVDATNEGTILVLGAIEITADVLVRDRASGGYDSLVDVDVPAACAPPDDDPPPPEDGCGCSATQRRGSPWSAFLFLLLVGVTFARRSFQTRRVVVRAILLVVGLVMVAPTSAFAFKCSRVAPDTGPSLVWETREIGWYAHPAAFTLVPNGEAEVRGSYETWEAIDCSDMTMPFLGVKDTARAEYNETGANENVVVAVASGWNYDRAAIAVTTSAYDTRTGQVVDADIEINSESFRFAVVDSSCRKTSGTMDLRNTLTHEVGHVLGLEHPPNSARYAETTMFASAPPCEIQKRDLAEDDQEGICTIYPTGQPTQQCFPPEGPNFALVAEDEGYGGCSHQSGRASPYLLLMPLLLLLRRRS